VPSNLQVSTRTRSTIKC